MSFTLPFAYSFYGGVGTSGDTPERWDCALNGRGYMLDTAHAAFRAGLNSIPLIRQQADSAIEPGESTVNPEDLWPRGQSSWHKGAGQKYLDAEDSDRARFRQSLGVDPWTKGQLSLQHSVDSVLESVETNLQVLRVGDYVYVANGNDVKWAAAPYSSLTDSVIFNGETPPQSVKSITSDGYTVWAALGSNGIHQTNRAASVSAHFSNLSATLVSYVKGRLMAANGNAIYNVTTAGAAPAALFTHPNTDFRWVGFAEGTKTIYAAGYSGDKSLIYRTQVKADGTALDIPVVAGELPDGEVVRSIQGYLGFVVVGTDIGFRIASQDTNGDLTFGALVLTNSRVQAFEPQDRFIWFGWENYDDAHTGLGRIDLTVNDAGGSPAYATDLMTVGEGDITSIITDVNNKRVFTVKGLGIFIESDDYVASGTLDSGLIGYGVPDPKIALRTALKHKPLAEGASIAMWVAADDAEYVYVGQSATEGTTAPPAQLKVPELSAQLFEVQVELIGPAVLERYDLRSFPAAARGRQMTVAILLHDIVTTGTGDEQSMDTRSEYESLDELVGSRQLVSYQELAMTFSVFVEEVNFQRTRVRSDRKWWNGTAVLKLKELGE